MASASVEASGTRASGPRCRTRLEKGQLESGGKAPTRGGGSEPSLKNVFLATDYELQVCGLSNSEVPKSKVSPRTTYRQEVAGELFIISFQAERILGPLLLQANFALL